MPQVRGLWFGGNATPGRCPAGGGHTRRGSGNYELRVASDGGGGQDFWRWCRKCQGLWYAGNARSGRCPAGRGHSMIGSGDYVLRFV